MLDCWTCLLGVVRKLRHAKKRLFRTPHPSPLSQIFQRKKSFVWTVTNSLTPPLAWRNLRTTPNQVLDFNIQVQPAMGGENGQTKELFKIARIVYWNKIFIPFKISGCQLDIRKQYVCKIVVTRTLQYNRRRTEKKFKAKKLFSSFEGIEKQTNNEEKMQLYGYLYGYLGFFTVQILETLRLHFSRFCDKFSFSEWKVLLKQSTHIQLWYILNQGCIQKFHEEGVLKFFCLDGKI